MRNPNELKVHQKALALVLGVYQLTTMFPSEEKFELVRQIRRAVVSVPSNIAEGCSRSSQKDFARFIEIAHGSLLELECQLGLARELAVMGILKSHGVAQGPAEFESLASLIHRAEEKAAEVGKMLISFGKTLRAET